MKTSLMMLGVVLTITACKKSSMKEQTINTAANQPDIISTVQTPANPANPYDSVGLWHNQILDGIQPCLASFTQPTLDETSGCVIQFAAKANLDLPGESLATIENLVKDQTNNYQTVMSTHNLTPAVRTGLDSLLGIIQRAATVYVMNYTDGKAAIEKYEKEIASNPQLLPDEQRLLLQCASVARYSFYRWKDYSPSGEVLSIRNIVKWIGTVTSDVAGFAVSGNVSYAADCSAYAYDLVNYSMP